MVERCLELLDGIESPRVVDVGTGSGAIALAIAQERPRARVKATDISPAALALAAENAEANGLEVEFREGDLLAGLPGPFDLIVSNPPYVDPDELDTLEPEVRDWEPRQALVADGQTERLAGDAQLVLDGWLVLEVHEARAQAVSQALEEQGYSRSRISNDLAGKERVVEAWWGTTQSTRDRRDPGGTAGAVADRHRLRACGARGSRGLRAAPLRAQGAIADPAERAARRRRRDAVRVRPGVPRPDRGDRARAASRAVHPRAAEPGRPLPLADRREATRSAFGCPTCRPPGGRCSPPSAGCSRRARTSRAAQIRSRSPTCRTGSEAAFAAELDVGPLPGTPSTVLDFTGPEPVVLREGATPSAAAIERVRAARSG